MTFFECTTVLAVLLFAPSVSSDGTETDLAQAGLDVTLMECGMGGRLDATNVLAPLVSVILPIHLEHQAPEAYRVINARAAELGAPLLSLGREFDAKGSWREASFQLDQRALGPVRLGLPGAHQLENAAVALGCLPQLEKHGIRADDAEVMAGLSRVNWPARFERFKASGEWIIDAAHNPAGAQVLASTIQDVFSGEKVRLVFGVLGDKRAEDMLEFLAPLTSRIDLVRSRDSRARDPQTLVPLIPGPALVHSSVEAALEQLWNEPGGPVVICGSLTVAGEARAFLERKGASPWSQGGEPARKAG
jgi:dihydrofolate synthase/folylpolyglutamate synthase